MRVVLDTNVIVSGFLTPAGPPGTILRLAGAGGLSLCYDARVLSEYREVLSRSKFGLSAAMVDPYLELIEAHGFLASASPLVNRLPDSDDEPFLEIAIAASAPLITGNMRQFPVGTRSGVALFTPAAFVERIRGGLREA